MPRFVQLLRLALVAGLVLAPLSRAHAGPDALIGRAAPPIRARSLDGAREVDFDRYRGRVLVLAFVATWCGACRRMAPALDDLLARHQHEGLTVLGLSHESRDRIRRHVARRAPRIPWLQCTGRTAVQYGADALPTLVVIGRDGRVRAAYQGADDDTVQRLTRAVRSLL